MWTRVSGATLLPNVVGLIFHEDQSGFLAGALAAKMTKTNTIAAVLGTDLIPPVVAFKEGYEAALPMSSRISTSSPPTTPVVWMWPSRIPSGALPPLPRRSPNGADVVFGAGGKTGNGALIEVAGNDWSVLHRCGLRPVGNRSRGARLLDLQRHEADHPGCLRADHDG